MVKGTFSLLELRVIKVSKKVSLPVHELTLDYEEHRKIGENVKAEP